MFAIMRVSAEELANTHNRGDLREFVVKVPTSACRIAFEIFLCFVREGEKVAHRRHEVDFNPMVEQLEESPCRAGLADLPSKLCLILGATSTQRKIDDGNASGRHGSCLREPLR